MQLHPTDMQHIARRVPRDVANLLRDHAGKLFVGGGFVRAIVAGEAPTDIDLFAGSIDRLELCAKDLAQVRPGSRLHKTKNAITVLAPNYTPVQFITRWLYDDPIKLISSFDFTVCQGLIYRGDGGNRPWLSLAGERFYIDLAARRLTYTRPVREEEAGGSMLRVIKFVKRGYSIQPHSLGYVIERLYKAVDQDRLHNGSDVGQIIGGLLREVDPLLVVDGLEIVDEHEEQEAAF